MVDSNYTHIVVLIDSSGSMSHLREDTKKNFNSLLAEQQALPGKATMSLYGFAHALYSFSPPLTDIKRMEPLTTYNPNGGTALLDSLYDVIVQEGKLLSALNEESRPGKVVVVVITDGEENCSNRVTKQQLFSAVRHQEDAYAWNFLYLGANVDAFAEAQAMGIRTSNALNYHATATSLGDTYAIMSSTLGTVRGRADLAGVKFDAYASSRGVDEVDLKELATSISVSKDSTSST